MRILKNLFLVLLTAVVFTSCDTIREVLYFQDLSSEDSEMALSEKLAVRVRPGDKISIIVNSRDPLLADLFNLPYVVRQLGSSQYGGTYRYPQGISGYTVDSTGCIDFPVLGKVCVEGKKREEISSYIKGELIRNNLTKDAVVTVEFMNLTFGIMGEVNKPGRYSIEKDRVTLLEGLTMAGDLTIFGNRENILVMREEGGVQKFYRVNLCRAEQLYGSPAYYIRQDDIIYVEPNKYRSRASNVNGNSWTSTSFWLSFGSLLVSIAVLIFK